MESEETEADVSETVIEPRQENSSLELGNHMDGPKSADKANNQSSLHTDESGIGAELSDSLYDAHLANDSKHDDLDLSAIHNTNHDVLTPDGSKSENSFTLCQLRKDDSGIYSEKSPNGVQTKDSDGDFSESISEEMLETCIPTSNNCVSKVEDGCLEAIVIENNHTETSANVDTNEKESDGITNNSEAEPGSVVDSPDSKHKLDNDDIKEPSMNTESANSNDIAVVPASALDMQVEHDTCIEMPDMETTDELENQTKATSEPDASRKCDTDSDSESEGATDKAEVKDKKGEKSSSIRKIFRRMASSSSSSSSESDVPPVRVRRRNRFLDSDDDENESEHGSANEAADENKSSSEDEDSTVDFTTFGPPKHKWRAMFDIRDREYGFSISSSPGYFRQKIQGSLQMVQRFDLQYKMDSHDGCVNALHFNTRGDLLASGSDDLNIVIWNWVRNRPALVYDSGHRSNVFQAKFMPYSGDCHIVSCARDGGIRLADLSSTGVCKGTKKIAQHRGAAHKLALEHDSPHIFLSCGEDAVTFQVDLREDKPNKLVTTLEKEKKVPMYSIHSNPTNSVEFCVGGRDHYIRIYDKRKIAEEVNGGVLKKFCPHHLVDSDIKANVTCACYNYNGTEVLGTYNDEDIYLFSNEHSDGANYIHRYQGHRNNQTVKGVNFYGPKSEFVVSGSDCSHVFLWDKETENIVQFMEGDDGGVVNVLEPHPFAPVLATSGLDHDVKIWAPTADQPTALKGLAKLVKANHRDRQDERDNSGGMNVDGQMLWFIMHHLRRGRRRRQRQERDGEHGDREEHDSSSTLSDESPLQSSASESDNEREYPSCNPS